MAEKTLISITELSYTNGLSISTIRRLVRRGQIPFVQPSGKGGKLLFPPDAVERSGLAANASVSPGRLAGRPPSWMTEQT
jgi:excisionase family DNA binding protein